MRSFTWSLLAVTFCSFGVVLADDAYYRVPLSHAATDAEPLPEYDSRPGGPGELGSMMRPYAVVEGGEAYVGSTDDSANTAWWMYSWSPDTSFIAVRAPSGAAVKGTLYVPRTDWSGMVARPFTIEAGGASDEAKNAFLRARLAHDERLLDESVAGSAFFRWRADTTRRELGIPIDTTPRPGAREMADTYDLFTGGRAVSENLQLYREMPGAPADDASDKDVMVKLAGVPGITIAEFDFKARLKGQTPATDELSALIPADQHAAFFPGFAALMSALDEAGNDALPLARALSQRSEDGTVAQRYERQMCLTPTALSRLLGPAAVRAVAITGSDPYFATGTDVAVLFRGANASGLRELFLGQVRAAAGAAGVPMTTGVAEGVAYEGAASTDRSLSSYVAVLGDAVVVTNSIAQLGRLGEVKAGKSPALGSTDEFAFFRSRYPAGREGETAFIFISDATIRRWCGAEWRIGASRRLRAAAIMADVTAARAREIVEGVNEPREVRAETPMRTIGTLTLGPSGVSSSVYGNFHFLTPIRELEITEAPKDEVGSYTRWRDGYQRNWSWAFDPIALSLSITEKKLGADLTVMPLIGSSDYQRWVGISKGASIEAGAGDPHETIAHFVMAINPQSPVLQNYAGMARMMAPQVNIEPLSWLGSSVAVYADPDPFWGELAAADNKDHFLETEAWRMPIALRAEVSSALKLTAFLAAVRGFIDQSSPGMLAWETREHHGKPYVKVGLSPTARDEARGSSFDRACVYYAPTPRALIVTLSEDVLTRALDRQAGAAGDDAKSAGWPGSNVCLRVAREGLALVRGAGREALETMAQRRAWSNLEILNEWRRMFPQRDPVEVHRLLFGTTLSCPAGSGYAWSDQTRSMESKVYGSPGTPREGPGLPAALDALESVDFGLSFEDDGLRARAALTRRHDASK